MGTILMPGGGGGIDLDVVTAAAGDVLNGKVIVGADGEPLTGTLALTGNAGTGDVLSGKTFYNADAKTKRTGTMTNQGAKTASLNCGGSYTIPAGYHNGSGKVSAKSLSSQTRGTASAGNILTGKTAWVNGNMVTGTMRDYSNIEQTATIETSDQTKSCYRNDGTNIKVVPAIGFWGSWTFDKCISIPLNSIIKITSGDWTAGTAGWCGFKPDIVFFRGNVSGTQFPIGIYCNVNGMYINVVEGQSQSHYGDNIYVTDTGWAYHNSMAYIDGIAIKYVCLKITP